MKISDVVSTAEVAKMYGVDEQTIRNWTQEGKLKGRRVGRNFVYDKEDLPLLGPKGKVIKERMAATAEITEKGISLLGIEDLALYLRVDKEKIPKLIASGLPYVEFKDEKVFVKSQVDDWLFSIVNQLF